jgi:hypothetical protein
MTISPTVISGFGHGRSWPPWTSRPRPFRGLSGLVVVGLLGVVGGRFLSAGLCRFFGLFRRGGVCGVAVVGGATADVPTRP